VKKNLTQGAGHGKMRLVSLDYQGFVFMVHMLRVRARAHTHTHTHTLTLSLNNYKK